MFLRNAATNNAKEKINQILQKKIGEFNDSFYKNVFQ